MQNIGIDKNSPIEDGFEKVLSPFQAFIKDQATSSVILIVCTIVALFIANSDLSAPYQALLSSSLGIVFNDVVYSMSISHWINDGLMTFFFFLLGMEIKREILVGEIRDLQRFLPIIAAALGGMIMPASLFYALNAGSEFSSGWGIPMATDTAFAVGVLALLGRCVPLSAVAFLTALAIIDDIGAIMVIALFYSDSINGVNLVLGFVMLLFLVVMNLLGVRRSVVYILGGVMVWLAMLGSGIHATVAGVLVAATVPARPKRDAQWFMRRVNKLLGRFSAIEQVKPQQTPILAETEQHAVVEGIQKAAEKSTTPLKRWENRMEHPVALFVLPVFALTNAGVILSFEHLPQLWQHSLALGVILGLVVGKGLGIPLFVWLALKLGLGVLPRGLDIRHVIGLGLLGGMGFTMSIFISGLGFSGQIEVQEMAKLAILFASLIAGCTGYIWLRFFCAQNDCA